MYLLLAYLKFAFSQFQFERQFRESADLLTGRETIKTKEYYYGRMLWSIASLHAALIMLLQHPIYLINIF